MPNDTENRDRWHTGGFGMWFFASFVLISQTACGGSPTQAALIDLPEFRVVAIPVTVGGPVQLEIVNSTEGPIRFDPPPCVTAIQRFNGTDWLLELPPTPQCTGLTVTVETGLSWSYLAETPPKTGLFRAVLNGTANGRAFILRSAGFRVE